MVALLSQLLWEFFGKSENFAKIKKPDKSGKSMKIVYYSFLTLFGVLGTC